MDVIEFDYKVRLSSIRFHSVRLSSIEFGLLPLSSPISWKWIRFDIASILK